MTWDACADLAPAVAHGGAFQLNRVDRYPTVLAHLGMPMNNMPERQNSPMYKKQVKVGIPNNTLNAQK